MAKPKIKKVKPSKKRKAGRPPIEIDMSQLEAFCQVLCTQEEIALFLGCSISTIIRRVKEATGVNFERFYKKHSSGGKMSLRRAQYKAAIGGNSAMLIWLGKQDLGQRDKPKGEEIATPQPVAITIQVKDASKQKAEG